MSLLYVHPANALARLRGYAVSALPLVTALSTIISHAGLNACVRLSSWPRCLVILYIRKFSRGFYFRKTSGSVSDAVDNC